MTPKQPTPALSDDETTVGSYFVSNYPPFSCWNPESVVQARERLERPPAPGTPLGVYLHIPFCRKRCHFCYFKVYTDKKSDEIAEYLDTVTEELRLYSQKPFIGGRKPTFIYLGGGTPSFLSTRQLSTLVEAMKRYLPWDEAEEVAFECEPGTLTEAKLRIIKELGITRLSLGIENFNDEILQLNGRAHLSKEIARSYHYARSIGFPQINIDLIAGMIGETEKNWKDCVRQTIELSPDCITAYQMEVPYNTTMFADMKVSGAQAAPVASWRQKRAWIKYAFAEFEKAGYTISSAYTAVKDPAKTRFLYRDLLWQGADMVGVGVASISHIGGVHFQNHHDIAPYMEQVQRGDLPIYRALEPTDEERLIREFILQFKLGHVPQNYFRNKFGVDVGERFSPQLRDLQEQGFLQITPESLTLNRDGLLQVDKLLHGFFLPKHRGARYA